MTATSPAARDDGQLATATAELERINSELAVLFGREPVKLSGGADESRADPLVMCGLLGGKDVGKSTLINTLAGQEISVDREEVGAGTSRPLVYVHQDMVAAAGARLDKLGGGLDLRFFAHTADAIRNIVLVDLPDFDSDFMRHQAIVQAVVPHLDRVVWVATPRKIGDRAWVAFARDVVKADMNVYFVLNKCDELLADEEGWPVPGDAAGAEREAEQFHRRERQWAQRVLAEAGHELAPDRMFLLAAKYPEPAAFLDRVGAIWDDPAWHRYGSDQPVVAAIGRLLAAEVERLRAGVLGPLDADEVAEVKERNLREQVRRNALRITQAYEIDHWLGQLERATDREYRQVVLNDAFGPDYCRSVAVALLRTRRTDVELADEVMDARAGQWPVLRVVYWLSRWLIRRVGRTLSGPGWLTGGSAGGGMEDWFRFRGRDLTDRVESLIDRLRTEQSAVVRQLQLRERLPEAAELAGHVESDLAELPRKGDDDLIDRLTSNYRPGWTGRLFVWGVLLWFPFIQPVAEGLLEMMAAGIQVTGWLHGLYRVVWALGATQLLKGFALVACIYVACLAAIYARCVRDVQSSRRGAGGGVEPRPGRADARQEAEALAEVVDQHIMSKAGEPVFQPFEAVAAQLGRLSEWLAALGR
jgi:hypothetical protein